jgi:6-methylsalicylate decarboxylase
MAAPHRIDVHHHPTPVLELMGGRVSGSPGIKGWTAALSLEDMDKNGVATAILSMPSRANVWRGGDQARNRAMARQWNEFMGRQGSDHPGRFGVFATVPILDIEGSLREAEYALDVLKADGMTLMTNIGDKWLGDPHYFPLFEELNRRKAIVYTHPISADCLQNKLAPEVDDSVIEFTADTSRAIARLLFSGAAHRFKDIRFIFSHAGGTMPVLAHRMEGFFSRHKEVADHVPNGAIAEIKKLHFDIASQVNSSAMPALLNLVPITQIMFGSDYPYVPIPATAFAFDKYGLPQADMQAINRDNALRLFPRLKT